MNSRLLKVQSVNCSIILSIPAKYFETINACVFWYEFVPGCSFEEVRANKVNNNYPQLTVISSKKFILSDKSNGYILHTNFDEASIKDIVVLCGYLLEKERQKKGSYTIHGSLIGKNGIAIGLIGGLSGTGKTSLAIYASQHGWTLLSDEKFVIKGTSGEVLATTSHLNLDRKVLDSLIIHDIGKLFSQKLSFQETYFIKFFVFPIISRQSSIDIHEVSNSKLYWHLYEESSRDIRLINGLVNNLSYPLQSLDTKYIAIKRAMDLNVLLNSINGYFVNGRVENIFSFTESLLTHLQTE